MSKNWIFSKIIGLGLNCTYEFEVRSITVFRCLSPFKIGIHIFLKQSDWADLSWNPFPKCIALICFGPNHFGKTFRGKIWIFCKSYFQFLRWNWVFRTNMESNAAFWGPCGPELLVFKRCVHFLVKNFKLFRKALLMNVKFFFLNILKTTHNSVWERVKNALSCTLLHLVFKIFKKKNFTFIKSVFHQQMHTSLKNK